MTGSSIKGPSPIIFMIPTHRMKIAILPTFIGTFIYSHQNIDFTVNIFEIIEFIIPVPNSVREVLGGNKGVISNNKIGVWRACRMALELGANQLIIPTPVIFGVSCCMNTNKASPGLYITFKSSLLIMVQYVSCCT